MTPVTNRYPGPAKSGTRLCGLPVWGYGAVGPVRPSDGADPVPAGAQVGGGGRLPMRASQRMESAYGQPRTQDPARRRIHINSPRPKKLMSQGAKKLMSSETPAEGLLCCFVVWQPPQAHTPRASTKEEARPSHTPTEVKQKSQDRRDRARRRLVLPAVRASLSADHRWARAARRQEQGASGTKGKQPRR